MGDSIQRGAPPLVIIHANDEKRLAAAAEKNTRCLHNRRRAGRSSPPCLPKNQRKRCIMGGPAPIFIVGGEGGGGGALAHQVMGYHYFEHFLKFGCGCRCPGIRQQSGHTDGSLQRAGVLEHNVEEQIPVASISKLMTLVLILEAVERGRIGTGPHHHGQPPLCGEQKGH